MIDEAHDDCNAKIRADKNKLNEVHGEGDTGMNSLITPFCVGTEINSLTNSDTEMNFLITANGSILVANEVYNGNIEFTEEKSSICCDEINKVRINNSTAHQSGNYHNIQSNLFGESDTGMNSLITPLCVSTEMNSLTNSDTEMNSLITADGHQRMIDDAHDDCNAKIRTDENKSNGGTCRR